MEVSIHFQNSSTLLKPRIKIAEAKRNGALFQLYQHDDKFGISLDGKELMNSNATASEYLLGKIGVEKIIKKNPARVLIGGLGLGFTLKSVLENTSNLVHVIVAEIIPEIIDWNRSYLTQLNGFLLNEPRVQVEQANVADLMFNTKNETYDSILLDLDNGPIPMTNNNNDFLYSVSGIKKIKSLLQDKGRLVIWSAGSDYNFENRLNFSSIKFKKIPARIHDNAKRARHMLYVFE